MKHEMNGHSPAADPLAPAELRAALVEVVSKAGRLIAALKSREREHRALTRVWSGLTALNLEPEGQP